MTQPRPHGPVEHHQAGHIRTQAAACGRLGSPMYADLLARVADDVEAGGPAAAVLAGHEDDPGPSALALRLAGSVHRLVLQREAGALAAHYPSVGGTFEAAGAWAELRDLLASRPERVREWLDRPPQTNEVGRSAALFGGLCRLVAEGPDLPVRLLELGASGGLNLHCDAFAHVGADGVVRGRLDSAVRLAWTGPSPTGPEPRVVERRGCDERPVDVTTTEGRLALTAYVWPDQVERHERLRHALRLVRRHQVDVVAQDAADFVEELDLRDGAWTVVAHSVMWQYLPRHTRERITAHLSWLGAAAAPDRPLAHLRAEPMRPRPGAEHAFLVALTTWPGGQRRLLGAVHPHGSPTTWWPREGP